MDRTVTLSLCYRLTVATRSAVAPRKRLKTNQINDHFFSPNYTNIALFKLGIPPGPLICSRGLAEETFDTTKRCSSTCTYTIQSFKQKLLTKNELWIYFKTKILPIGPDQISRVCCVLMHEPKKSTRRMKSLLLNLSKVSASYLSTLHHACAPPPPPPPHSDSEYW